MPLIVGQGESAMFVPAVSPASAPTDRAWCFAFFDAKLLLPDEDGSSNSSGDDDGDRHHDAGLLLPNPPPVWDAVAGSSARHYLGRLDGLDCWALTVDRIPAGWQAVPLRAAMMRLAEPLAQLAGRAAQLIEWERAHRFCGVCATPTEARTDERSRRCPGCGHVVYPRLSPAMMVLVLRGRELLLARAPTYAPGMYSALAGFVEAGESLEDCVHREVAEEVGLRVADLRYYGSQSWPFPHSLMVAYTAQWAGGEIVPQANEIEAAGWFGIDALPGIPPRFSIAGHLIRDTVAALRDLPPGR